MPHDQRNQQMAPAADGYPRSDEEAANLQSKEHKMKKTVKCAIYIAAFAVFQTAIILLFVLVVMKLRTPELRLSNMNVQSLVASTGASSSLDIKVDGLVTVSNTNLGDYSFHAENVTLLRQGVTIGQVSPPPILSSPPPDLQAGYCSYAGQIYQPATAAPCPAARSCYRPKQ